MHLTAASVRSPIGRRQTLVNGTCAHHLQASLPSHGDLISLPGRLRAHHSSLVISWKSCGLP